MIGLRHHRAHRRRHAFGQRDVVHPASAALPGYGCPSHLQPRDVAAFLVGGHHGLTTGLPQLARQPAGLLAVHDVVAEETDPAEAALQPAEQPRWRRRPAERGQEAAVDDGVEVHVSP